MIDIILKKRWGEFIIQTAFLVQGATVVALFGQSGAGKTSVINMISGLINPDEGHISINGHCLFDSQKGICLPPEKRRFGYVFQDGRLFPHLTVRSNLSYGMKSTASHERYVTFDKVVGLLGIENLLHRHPANLSGGEKQRVAIGRALLTSPEGLLMDEPLASLDRARKEEVLPFIDQLHREFSIPILYVTHDLDEIWALADSMVFLHSGKTVAGGSVEDVTSRADFLYLTNRNKVGSLSPKKTNYIKFVS
jgi:molybdate transport system ATP-binding protein